MNRRVTEILLGLFALGLAVAGGWYARNTYLHTITVVQMPVPAGDIAPYTLLRPDMFVLQEFPRALTGQGYIESLDALGGKMAVSTLLEGMPVPSRLALPPEQHRLAPPEYEVVSIPIEPKSAVAGEISIGDWVNVYRISAEEPQDEVMLNMGVVLTPTEVLSGTGLVTEVDYIDTLPVVDLRGKNGERVEMTPAQNGQVVPPAILVVGVQPGASTRALLEAIAASKTGNNQLWITLAAVEDGG